MKIFSGVCFAAVVLLLGLPQCQASSLCSATAGNLVSNCGFETGDFTSWTLSGNDVPGELNNLYGVEGQDPFDLIDPNSGNYQAFFADLDSNATTLSQTIATVAGATYTISWYLAQDATPGTGDYSNEFSASFGGVSLLDVSALPAESYTEYSFTATAAASSAVISMTFGNALGEFLVDDVAVVQNSSQVQLPEPSTWGLALGGAMLAFVFRRKLAG